MAALPKLDASTSGLRGFNRPSRTNTLDSDQSARSSVVSVSDSNSNSTRLSFSSLDSLSRASSFSRTSSDFQPDSPIDTSLGNPASSDGTTRMSDGQKPNRFKDGAAALSALGDVRDVLCVAFGAFDRYYLSWEDNDGALHQDSQSLPPKLYEWLFPQDGTTRHLQSLQVSFSSGDEFFASDKFGKISSRDPSAESKAAPKLAEVARGFMRRKAQTVSEANVLEATRSGVEPSKLERRPTLLGDQPTPYGGSILNRISAREAVASRNEAHPEQRVDHRRKRSVPSGVPPVRPSWPDRKTLSTERERIKAEESRNTAQPNRPEESTMNLANYPQEGERLKPVNAAPDIFPAVQQPLDRLMKQEKPQERLSYTNAAVQTDFSISEYPLLQPCQFCCSIGPGMPMGSMQDFFREQHSLGDALRYV